MNTLVIYDITDDELRNKISQTCKDYGLVRIQKSAFLGNINSQRRKSLTKSLERRLGSNLGNIQIFVICNADMRLRKIIGSSGYDKQSDNTIFI